MPEINLHKTIICPDFGEIKINQIVSPKHITDFIELKLDTSKQFDEFIKAIISLDPIHIDKLTEKDLEFITLEFTRIYQVDKLYLSLRTNIPRPEALQGALKESPKIKGIEKALTLVANSLSERFKEYDSAYKRIIDSLNLPQETLNNATRMLSVFEEVKRGGVFQDYIGLALTDISVPKSLIKSLTIDSRDLMKSFEATIDSLKIASQIGQPFRQIVEQLSLKSNAITDALKFSVTFHDKYRTAVESISKDISNISELKHQFNLADEAIRSSEKLVIKTNNYFSTWWKIPEIPRRISPSHELAEQKERLKERNEESEHILEMEADTSILATNKIVYSLPVEIRELKKEISGLKALNRRLQILENPKSFLEYLNRFAEDLGNEYWEAFWEIKGDKFIFHPERVAHGLLGLSLKNAFYGTSFVGREIRSGNGFIDLFIYSLGIKHIIEIKIVGTSWSIENAEDGIAQLNEYMHSENKEESYLVVLDGRKTRRGKQLEKVYEREYGKVYVVTSKIYWERPS